MSQMSCPDPSVLCPSALPRQPCPQPSWRQCHVPGSPFISVLSRVTFQANLFRLSCPACLVLSALSELSCPSCPISLPRLSCLSCPSLLTYSGRSAYCFLSCLYHPVCLLLLSSPAVLNQLSFLAVLSQLSCYSCSTQRFCFTILLTSWRHCHFLAVLYSPSCLD